MGNQYQKPKQKRSFKFIIRFFQFIFALILVFFASFFVTLYLSSPTPSEDISSGVELISDLTEDEKNNSSTLKTTEENKSEPARSPTTSTTTTTTTTTAATSTDKKTSTSTYGNNLGFFQRVERLSEIEKAVNDKVYKSSNYVFLHNIPKNLIQAIVAVEDSRFYTHDGYDLKGILRATVDNVEAGEIEEGGSTITQQLAKNLFLTNEQSFTRKAEELLLARQIEKHFSKDKIIEFYLNTIYFGSNFYGIYDAAHGYFGKEPKELTLAESAMLAGLPNAPSLYSPYVNFMLAKKRQMTVIDAMLREKVITSAEAENARIEEIVLVRE